jgi:hypothetical protein
MGNGDECDPDEQAATETQWNERVDKLLEGYKNAKDDEDREPWVESFGDDLYLIEILVKRVLEAAKK